jgi:flavin-dependent dehydrogenase
MYDVIVVGAGPAGSIAAKYCVQAGLKTLLVDRYRLPRDKMCTGLLFPKAIRLVEESIGNVPKDMLKKPDIKGIKFITRTDEYTVPLGLTRSFWRRDFDYWLTKKAVEAGAEVWEGMGLIDFGQTEKGVKGYFPQEEYAKYMIGADGLLSSIRQQIKPVSMSESHISFQEYHKGTVDLDGEYFTLFPNPEYCWDYPAAFHLKDGLITFQTNSAPRADVKPLYQKFMKLVEKNYSFKGKVVGREACLIPKIESFTLGEGRILLTGDAVGLMNVIGEGISLAVLSAIQAAKAITVAEETSKPVLEAYKDNMREITESSFDAIRIWSKINSELRSEGSTSLNLEAEIATRL